MEQLTEAYLGAPGHRWKTGAPLALLLCASLVAFGCEGSGSLGPGSDDDDSADTPGEEEEEELDFDDCFVTGGEIDAGIPVPYDPENTTVGTLLVLGPNAEIPESGLPIGETLAEGQFVVGSDFPVSYVICLPEADFLFVAITDTDDDGEVCSAGDFFGWRQMELIEAEPYLPPLFLTDSCE